MLLEDRVITTDQLRAVNAGTAGWLQLGPGVLDRLDPVGFHVLVPVGHLHVTEDHTLMSCIVELQTSAAEPLKVRVLLPHEVFTKLPSAFEVLARIPATATGMVTELEAWMIGGDGEVDDAAA